MSDFHTHVGNVQALKANKKTAFISEHNQYAMILDKYSSTWFRFLAPSYNWQGLLHIFFSKREYLFLNAVLLFDSWARFDKI